MVAGELGAQPVGQVPREMLPSFGEPTGVRDKSGFEDWCNSGFFCMLGVGQETCSLGVFAGILFTTGCSNTTSRSFLVFPRQP